MLPNNFNEELEVELAAFYTSSTSQLNAAISYALLGPGKRLRPKLAYLCAMDLSVEKDPKKVFASTLPAMLAIEMVHCYSLVHDDLPAMDNDDYRRGRLSCHKKYGEALGILVGDALIADAFYVLSAAQLDPLLQIRELAGAIGSKGMVLGQHSDLTLSPTNSNFDAWLETHMLKTGRLFECACVLGAFSVGAPERGVEMVRLFAREFGVAFQLKDDVSDDSTTVRMFGKSFVESVMQQKIERAKDIATDLNAPRLFQIALDLLA